jgi:CRP/FNR family transcriptional regulator, cyclic AMP receptor protein
MNQFGQKPLPDSLDPLDRVGWLAEQPDSFRSWAEASGRWRRFAAGETLYLAGDAPDGMYGLGAGALDLSFPLESDEPVAIHRAEPGFWFGEAALMAGSTRLATVTAAADSRVFHLSEASLRDLLAREPDCWRNLYEQSFSNLAVALRLLAEALSLSPRARLARLLLRLADDQGRVHGNQEDFARLIGMTRSSVRRAVASIIEAGAIRTGYGRLEVVDIHSLARISRDS